MPTWLRSIVSVLIGFIVFYALQGLCTFAAARLLHLSYDQPTAGYIVANVVYTLLAALIGGYVTARIAPSHPLAHGIGTAALLLPLAIFNLNKGFGGQETEAVVVRSLGTPLFAILGAALDRGRHRTKVL